MKQCKNYEHNSVAIEINAATHRTAIETNAATHRTKIVTQYLGYTHLSA